ncbi:SGNH/GDSL hydrolase family protein [Arthrobacter sp. S39]|uniref:SGNH/GDSL hydrolase family protein n=1 Tax=Arthrobacter sp. S39 TaxID=2509720 RepID=UPI001037D7B6|nr:SGNH/GDSL hydrolase family protein [Arthrobacter sp. S39]TAP41108.1 SGNH/GDSL hydrolase family protein [Arthrobacter sp. S39]
MTLPTGRRRRPAFAAGLATLAMALGFTAMPAGAAPPPRDVDYVAVGDSYSAGTGADTIGTTATGPFVPTLPCTQTANGYVDKVDLAAPVVLVKNAACHGALLADPTLDGVTSVEDQIAQLTLGGKLSKDTELVSMTAGANDAGVSNVLFKCIAGSPDDCSGAVVASQLALPQVRANLIEAFAAIHREAPRARIVVLGYAKLFNTAGFAVIPVDRQELINAGTVGLNTTIASAAAEANTLYGAQVQFVDVTARFAGHEVNTLSPWLFLSQVDPFEPRNFHPNQAGHAQYAEALLASVNLKQLARP